MAGPVTYHTDKFPPQNLVWERLVPLLGAANAALARYDGLLTAIPNAAVLLSLLTTQEAVLSSRIEGTQATMGEVLEYEAGGAGSAIDDEKKADIEEVLNYRRAMRQATEMMADLPLCNRLIKAIHETLVSGVRGHDKVRGKFRTIQNYIFNTPIFNASDLIEQSKIPAPTARRILGVLTKSRLLKTLRKSRGRRPAIFAFSELLNITEGRVVFDAHR